jgi:hypothetical protein
MGSAFDDGALPEALTGQVRARSIRPQVLRAPVLHDAAALKLPVLFAHRLDPLAASRKDQNMTTKSNNDRPIYRVTFSRITGKDENGGDVLSRPKEIGAVWPRKGNKLGAILSLDLIPVELAQRQGVIFLVPADRDENGGE